MAKIRQRILRACQNRICIRIRIRNHIAATAVHSTIVHKTLSGELEVLAL